MIEWVFDPAPPSLSRSGGRASEYSFEGRIDTLVREVVQDQPVDSRRGETKDGLFNVGQGRRWNLALIFQPAAADRGTGREPAGPPIRQRLDEWIGLQLGQPAWPLNF